MGRLTELADMVREKLTAPPDDQATEEQAPFLWEMLTTSRWGDETERLLPRIVIERVPGAYRVTLQDDSLCIRKGCLVKTLAEVVPALEKALCDQEIPWEPFKSYRNKAGAKVVEKQKPPRQKKR